MTRYPNNEQRGDQHIDRHADAPMPEKDLKIDNLERSLALVVERRTEERNALLKELRQCEQLLLAARDLGERAAEVCDHEANLQATYANEAGTPGLRLIHSTVSNTLMSVAQRIRALKGA